MIVDDELRRFTRQCANEMHIIYQKGVTPSASLGKHCQKCSLYDICVPLWIDKGRVDNYLNDNLYEETP